MHDEGRASMGGQCESHEEDRKRKRVQEDEEGPSYVAGGFV